LLLQFIPYSLAIGAGIKCGVDFYNKQQDEWMAFVEIKNSKKQPFDLGYVYIVVVPLFFIASCFEFLSAWNV